MVGNYKRAYKYKTINICTAWRKHLKRSTKTPVRKVIDTVKVLLEGKHLKRA